MAPPFDNRYKKSHVKTEKDCWTCRKNTTVCLLTDNYASGGDFLYTCEAHLKDHNFATPISESEPTSSVSSSPGLSQADIDAAVKEYEERKKAKEQADKTEEKDEEKQKNADTKSKLETAKKATAPSSPPLTSEPTHYELHKSFFDMRLRLHQQKKQLREAQVRRSQLVFPSAPAAQPGAKG